jgi:hypothetical protein
MGLSDENWALLAFGIRGWARSKKAAAMAMDPRCADLAIYKQLGLCRYQAAGCLLSCLFFKQH